MAHLRTLTKALSYQPMPLYRDTKPALSVKLDLNALCIRHPIENGIPVLLPEKAIFDRV